MNASDAPTSRMISISSDRATTASRIVLTMMNSTITPTIADHHDPRGAHEGRDREHAIDQGLDVEHVADQRVVAQGGGDGVEVRRAAELHVDARVERVRLERGGQVRPALGRLRRLEPRQRLVARHELGRRDLGHRVHLRHQRVDLVLGRVVLDVGDDLDLLLDERQAREEHVLEDEEAGEQQQHQDHRQRGREAHQRVAPEPLPGPADRERDERDHVLSPRGGTWRRSRPG